MKTRLITIIVIATLFSTSTLFAGFKETDKLLLEAKKEVGEIGSQKLKKMIDNEDELILLDIRETEQRAEGRIYADETYEITRGNLEFKVLNKIKDKDAIIVTYCRGGSKSAFAAQTLKRLGYKNATNLKGGLKAWVKAGYPIETGLGVMVLTKEDE